MSNNEPFMPYEDYEKLSDEEVAALDEAIFGEDF